MLYQTARDAKRSLAVSAPPPRSRSIGTPCSSCGSRWRDDDFTVLTIGRKLLDLLVNEYRGGAV